MDELLDPKHVSVGAVIDSVLGLIPVYETTESDLRIISNSINGVADGSKSVDELTIVSQRCR
jgi:hypothetical protein